jgi:chromosome segregation ATPase
MPFEVVALVGALSSGLITFLLERLGIRERPREPTFEQRVEAAAKALREASTTVDELGREIETRQEQVERLRDQQKLLELSKEQILAVSRELQADAVHEGRRAIWIGVAASTFFFFAGVVITLVAG